MRREANWRQGTLVLDATWHLEEAAKLTLAGMQCRSTRHRDAIRRPSSSVLHVCLKMVGSHVSFALGFAHTDSQQLPSLTDMLLVTLGPPRLPIFNWSR